MSTNINNHKDKNPELEELLELIIKKDLVFEQIRQVEEKIAKLDKTGYDNTIKMAFQHIETELKFPLNNSEANKGFMGAANFIGKIIKRLKRKTKNTDKIIVVEGDSWFEHFFIKDIIDHLLEVDNYSIHTIAYGGDWLANYLEKPKYIDILIKKKPDVFLLSGGGNDLVGNQRIKNLVYSRDKIDLTEDNMDNNLVETLSSEFDVEIAKRIVKGRKFLGPNFWILRNVFYFQYILILKRIALENSLSNLKIIVQGYDFAIPSNDKNNLFRKILGHSGWLFKPLTDASIKINEPEEQKSVIAAMIYEFNEMLRFLAENNKNVYFVDCRGAAKENEWNDELHLYSKVYKNIASTYQYIIDEKTKGKTIKVRNYQNFINQTNSTEDKNKK